MLVRRVDISRRLDRHGALLEAIEAGSDLCSLASPLQLTADEKTGTLERLSADIYAVSRTRLYILLRLGSALSAGGVTYDLPTITVEHVLPQNPPASSMWRKWFTDAERQQWVHRLANLVLLAMAEGGQDLPSLAPQLLSFGGPARSGFVVTEMGQNGGLGVLLAGRNVATRIALLSGPVSQYFGGPKWT